jgi:hypothetical protein
MFKVGDSVVCIDHIDYDDKPYGKLELNKIYTINYVSTIHKLNDVIGIKELDNIFGGSRFILLSKYRKQKIKRICSKLETK